MAARYALRRAVVGSSARRAVRGGGHHHEPMMPPMARQPLPSRKLPEEQELMWDDGVAPELCLDFDAPHVSRAQGLAWWLGGLTFFAVFYNFIGLTNPDGKREALQRVATMPPTAFDPVDIFTGKRGRLAAAEEEE